MGFTAGDQVRQGRGARDGGTCFTSDWVGKGWPSGFKTRMKRDDILKFLQSEQKADVLLNKLQQSQRMLQEVDFTGVEMLKQ